MNDRNEWNPKPAIAGPLPGFDWWGMLWRRKWFLVIGLVCGAALGYLYYSQQDPVYESKSLVLVSQSQASLPIAALGGEDQIFNQLNSTITTQSLILRSPLVVTRAVQGNYSAEDDELRELIQSIDKELSSAAADKAGEKDGTPRKNPDLSKLASLHGKDVVSAIIEGLTVEPAESGSEVLRLSYRGGDPEDCRVVLDAVFHSYKTYLKGSRDSATKETYRLISKAKNELAAEIESRDLAYRRFRSDNAHLLFKGEGGQNLHYERMGGIETRRQELLVEQSQLQAKLKTLQAALARGENNEQILMLAESAMEEDPAFAKQESLARQLLPLMMDELRLKRDFGNDHPDVVTVREQIQLMRSVLSEFVNAPSAPLPGVTPQGGQDIPDGNPTDENRDGEKPQPLTPNSFVSVYVGAMQQQLHGLQMESQELDAIFNEQQDSARKLEQMEAEEESMLAEIGRKKQLFDVIIKRLEEISLTDDLGGYDAEQIAPASIGEQVEPQLVKTLTLSIFLGMLAGFGLSYVIELADKTFRTAEEIKQALGLPLIGHVQAMNKAQFVGADSDPSLDPSLVCFHKPSSHHAEDYRAVRTALYFGIRGRTNQVLHITSPSSGDGKSTTCANLSIAIAQSNKRVLIIDADLRRPTQHKLFGLSRKRGVSSVIEGEFEPHDAIQETKVENLFLLTAGPQTKTPADLLTSPRFHELIQSLRDKFDFVIIDSPPILAVSDSSAIAPRVDGTILVLRITKRVRSLAKRAAETLESMGCEVLGVVVNGIGNKGYGYGSSNYKAGDYGYGYGYGYGSPYGERPPGSQKYFEEEHVEELDAG